MTKIIRFGLKNDTQIVAIPCLETNYIFLLQRKNKAICVDVGDAAPFLEYLKKENLPLLAILLTHHHSDHTAGAPQAAAATKAKIIGPSEIHSCPLDEVVGEGSKLDIPPFSFSVYHTPGHTKESVCFHEQEMGVLFTGDTLFAGGCGRLFEGDASDLLFSMKRIRSLPKTTLLCSGHEYARENLRFAACLEPENVDIARRRSFVEKAHLRNQPTAIAPLQEELDTNPFMRFDQPELLERLRSCNLKGPKEVLAYLREKKDKW